MTAVRRTLPSPTMWMSTICPTATRLKIMTFLKMPLKPTSLESFFSTAAAISPVM